ncbi:MAG TPA: 2-hydroxyacyl-CoA dehydratase family protein, partial [Caldisericia bacterium]|nr:2-hydroxyacyl-CoA dehydratase family protein [Caldisericia bacterium]
VLHAKSIISCQERDFKAYEKIISEAENSGDRYSHKPRILLTGVPLPHQAEKVLKLIEEAGAVVVAQENCTGLKPIVDPVSEQGDLLENIARKYFKLPCSVMMPNKDRFGLLDSLIEKFRPHGVIDLVWQACHTYNIESVLVKKHVQEKWRLPFLKIETDYSPSDTEQLRIRIEAFLSVASQNNLKTSH